MNEYQEALAELENIKDEKLREKLRESLKKNNTRSVFQVAADYENLPYEHYEKNGYNGE